MTVEAAPSALDSTKGSATCWHRGGGEVRDRGGDERPQGTVLAAAPASPRLDRRSAASGDGGGPLHLSPGRRHPSALAHLYFVQRLQHLRFFLDRSAPLNCRRQLVAAAQRFRRGRQPLPLRTPMLLLALVQGGMAGCGGWTVARSKRWATCHTGEAPLLRPAHAARSPHSAQQTLPPARRRTPHLQTGQPAAQLPHPSDANAASQLQAGCGRHQVGVLRSAAACSSGGSSAARALRRRRRRWRQGGASG